MRLTRQSARIAGACYTDDRIAELVPPDGLSPRQVAALPIPPRDRHWALVRACGAPDRILREHACWCARRALGRVASPDPRSVCAVDVAERHILGEASDGELLEARRGAAAATARATAATAATAAYAATAATAATAARAAYAASYAAAYVVADAAAVVADALTAEREAQILDLAERVEA